MERRLQGANDIFVGWTLMGKQLHTSGHTDVGVEEMEHFGGPQGALLCWGVAGLL